MTTFEAPHAGPISFSTDADFLILEVATADEYAVGTVELTGPDDVLEAATMSVARGEWTLNLPRVPGSRGGTTIIQSGGSVYMSGGIQVGHFGGGRVVVNGVDVTSLVNAATPEPLRARVFLPAGSSLSAGISAGAIRTTGILAAVSASTASADLEVDEVGILQARAASGDIYAGRVTGHASMSTASGDITVGEAFGAIDASAASGDITVHAGSVAVTARAASGDIRVTAMPGCEPLVRARSMSGRVRTPR